MQAIRSTSDKLVFLDFRPCVDIGVSSRVQGLLQSQLPSPVAGQIKCKAATESVSVPLNQAGVDTRIKRFSLLYMLRRYKPSPMFSIAASGSPDSRRHRAGVEWGYILMVILGAFAGSFCRLNEFGFYEDDYWAVVPYLYDDAGDIWHQIGCAFQWWPTGRPLQYVLPQLFGWLGFQSGHIWGIYLLCAVVIVANALLVYRLIGGLMGPLPALAGALWFTLYPADTTRPFIVHAAHLQTGLTLCLCGLLLYRSGGWRRRLSYAVAGSALLAYEPTFLPFVFGVPMLIVLDQRQRWRFDMLKHAIGSAVVVGVCAAARLSLGEGLRVTKALSSISETLWRMLSSLYIGPTVSAWPFPDISIKHISIKHISIKLGLLKVDPWEGWGVALWSLPENIWNALPVVERWEIGVVALFGLAVFVLFCSGSPTEGGRKTAMPTAGIVLAGGLLMWVGSYGLTIINYPPTAIYGRLTSVHMAGAVGNALAFAAGVAMLLNGWPGGRWQRVLSAGLLGVGFSLLMANGLSIQRDYASAWTIQQRFWHQVLAAVPDLRRDDLVVLSGKRPSRPKAILANSWADSHVLQQLVEFEPAGSSLVVPQCVKKPPGGYTPSLYWSEHAVVRRTTAPPGREAVFIRPGKSAKYPKGRYLPQNTILLSWQNGAWHRVSQLELPASVLYGRMVQGESGSVAERGFRLSKFGQLMLGNRHAGQ